MARRRRYRTRKTVSDGVFLAILGVVAAIALSSMVRVNAADAIRTFWIVLAIALFLGIVFFAAKYSRRWYIEHIARNRRRSGLYHLQDKEHLLLVHPTEFEKLVCEFFSLLGYKVQHTGQTNDGGIDGQMWKDGKTYTVQAKRYRENVGVGEVRDFYGSYVGMFDAGFFVTTSDFSPRTRAWAKSRGLELISGAEFVSRIPRETLERYFKTN